MKQLNWYQIFGKSNIPDGRTVLPTDDIQIWLNCANIWDKTYTTLAEVLADTDTLLALINSNNAVDYLVRSTKWAGIQLVPDMTDNTHPSGECSADSNSANAYKGFINSGWESAGNSSYPHWLCYDFQAPTRIGKVEIWENGNYYGKTGSVQAYVNGAWEDIYTINKNSAGLYDAVIPSVVTAEKYRYKVTSGQSLSTTIDLKVYDIFLYSENLCDNSTAMSYIGLNNYCANTLLADSTWCEAICNSEYFESVLNVKVPTMTSASTPAGTVYCGNYYNETYAGWRAYPGENAYTNHWASEQQVGNWNGYDFGRPVKIYKTIAKSVTVTGESSSNYGYSLEGLNDSLVWENVQSGGVTTGATPLISAPTRAYSRYRMKVTSIIGTTGLYLRIYGIQFYGREDV